MAALVLFGQLKNANKIMRSEGCCVLLELSLCIQQESSSRSLASALARSRQAIIAQGTLFPVSSLSSVTCISGPYKVNGVPLRRVNQSYVIATSAKVDISSVKLPEIDDAYFARDNKLRETDEEAFFNQLKQVRRSNVKPCRHHSLHHVELERAMTHLVSRLRNAAQKTLASCTLTTDVQC